MLGVSAFLMISDDRLERELPLSLSKFVEAEVTLGSPRLRSPGLGGLFGSYILSTMLLNRPLASAA
jgi:hypothetical protein